MSMELQDRRTVFYLKKSPIRQWLSCLSSACRAVAVAAHHGTPQRRPCGPQRAVDAELQGRRSPAAHRHVGEGRRARADVAQRRQVPPRAAARGLTLLPARQEGDRRRCVLVRRPQRRRRRDKPQRHAVRRRSVYIPNC